MTVSQSVSMCGFEKVSLPPSFGAGSGGGMDRSLGGQAPHLSSQKGDGHARGVAVVEHDLHPSRHELHRRPGHRLRIDRLPQCMSSSRHEMPVLLPGAGAGQVLEPLRGTARDGYRYSRRHHDGHR